MVYHTRLPNKTHHCLDPDGSRSGPAKDLLWPFGKLDGLDRDDLREAAYEIFFTACRSSPGFGGRSTLTYYNPSDGGDGSGPGSPMKSSGVGMSVNSRVKRALCLKMMKRSNPSSRRSSSCGSNPMSPSAASGAVSSPRLVAFSTVPQPRMRRPMTAAEIARQQMRVTEQSDNRLRKTLMRTLVGQVRNQSRCHILLKMSKYITDFRGNRPNLELKVQNKITSHVPSHPCIVLEETKWRFSYELCLTACI